MTTDSPNYEQELAEILSLLNPPQQDYDILADKALHFLNDLPEVSSIERTLAAYFELFASGYAIWQQTYDYPRIHTYFYGGYLKAKEIAEDNYPELVNMLEAMTKAMIAYTNCENALINGDPQSLFLASEEAVDCVQESRKSLKQALAKTILFEPIDQYLEMNFYLWKGFNISAKGYLDSREGKELSDPDRSAMEKSLQILDSKSHELFSELNAHYSFVQRHSTFRKQITSSIRVKKGQLFLRAIGYVGDKEVSALFVKYNKEGSSKEFLQDIKDKTGLPIEGVRDAIRMDVFETALGKKYLSQLIFELSPDPDDARLALYMNGREIQFDLFHIRIARLGIITVEFGLPLENATISEVRTLETLIGPHAGRFKFVWKWKDNGTESDGDVSDAKHLDFVEYFLYCQEWVDALQKKKSQDQPLELATGVLENWENDLSKLAYLLEQNADNDSEEEDESLEDESLEDEAVKESYAALLTDFHDMFNIIKSYHENNINTIDLKMKEIAQKVLHKGKMFGQVMDIADFIIDRMQKYLEQKYGLTREKAKQKKDTIQDIRYISRFDCNTGWQSILNCYQLVLVEDGEELDPHTETEYRMLMKQPEFKGLAIQSREARSAIDDWLFVDMPQMRNLGPIRSHAHDVLYVGTNKIFMWFPDDPDFLVDQYVETARFIGNIRTLVLIFNSEAKTQIDDLEKLLDEIENPHNGRHSHPKNKMKGMLQESQTLILPHSLKEKEEKLLERRNGIEVFRTHAERILDYLRAFTISKYQDHGELMKWMLQESQTSDLQIALEKNINNLDHFHGYISNLLHQRIEKRNQSNQAFIAVALFILALLSGLSVFPSLQNFLDDFFPHKIVQIGIASALILVVVGCIVAGFVVLLRSRNT